ncbi:hypothetical protein [Kocuria rosea]|uniref:hypothetical protein n=1 Tax=Kocuria rosea TaxID=1275 RepID=UPI00232F88C0|nr:hypothetical protein [Kocuria rosea]
MSTPIDMPTPSSAVSWAALKNRLATESPSARQASRIGTDRIERTRHVIHAVALEQALQHMVIAEGIGRGTHSSTSESR